MQQDIITPRPHHPVAGREKRLERQVADLQKKLVFSTAASSVETINGTKTLLRHVGDIPAKELNPIATDLLKSLGESIVTLISTADGKAAIIVAISDSLSAQHSAVDLVRLAAAAVGGAGGGGNKTMAQAGGPDGNAWQSALTAIRTTLAGT